MARGRPQKQTVDYFPHYTGASDGKTLFILQSKFGNDGYAFWFKVLEILGSTEGHFFDYRKATDWQFLLAKTGISDDNKATEILQTLADVEAIDPALHQQKVIWCQKFVDNLANLYKRRAIEFPQRPIISADNNSINGNIKPILASSNTQSKVKETKLEESKEEETKLNSSVQFSKSIEEVRTLYQDNILLGATIPEEVEDELKIACGRFSPDWVYDAIREALAQNHPDWGYITGILKNWARHGKKT